MSSRREFDAESSGIEDSRDEVHVRFSMGLSIAVRGPVTQRIYRFSQDSPIQAVDARDVVSITKTGLFRQVL